MGRDGCTSGFADVAFGFFAVVRAAVLAVAAFGTLGSVATAFLVAGLRADGSFAGTGLSATEAAGSVRSTSGADGGGVGGSARGGVEGGAGAGIGARLSSAGAGAGVVGGAG